MFNIKSNEAGAINSTSKSLVDINTLSYLDVGHTF